MKSATVESLLAEFMERGQAASAAGDIRLSVAWHDAWQMLEDALHQSRLAAIRSASERKITKIRRMKVGA